MLSSEWSYLRSPKRKLTGSIIPLYLIIRRPTHILDFSLTLVFLHIVFSTYSAKAFPLSIFFWVTLAFGAITMITVAEQVRFLLDESQAVETAR